MLTMYKKSSSQLDAFHLVSRENRPKNVTEMCYIWCLLIDLRHNDHHISSHHQARPDLYLTDENFTKERKAVI